MGNLVWSHCGPRRPQSVEVPPAGVGLLMYGLVYDPKRDRIVYVTEKDYGQLEQWTYDGKAFVKAKGGGRLEGEGETHAYYDHVREGIVFFTIEHDSDVERIAPNGALVTEGKFQKLKAKGDSPLIEPEDAEDFYLSSSKGAIIGFDAGLGVGVCITRRGIWQLGDDNVWVKVYDLQKPFKDIEWHDDNGAVWDPVAKKLFVWIEDEKKKYKHQFFAWDGVKLAPLSSKGLPELHVGLFDSAVAFVGHPKHGVVAHIGGELFALDGSAWKKLPSAKGDVPAKMEKTRLAYDPKRDAFLLGPGNFEDDPGGSDTQAVFHELRDGTWTRMGVIAKPALIEKLYGRRHVAHGSRWYATARSALHTMQWNGEDWVEVVDEKTGDKLVGNDRLGALAETPDGVVAVTQKGAVFRLENAKWKPLAKASSAFKERSDFVLAHDGTRLVAWGGQVKGRKSNDTLVFDGKKWEAVKAASPQPKDFKLKDEYVDFTVVRDTALGRLVRFGYQEVAVLDGDVWTPYTPTGYTELVGTRAWGHFPAHDAETGETLLVNFDTQKIIRFDLAKCVEVEKFAYDKDVVKWAKKADESLEHLHREDCIYNPSTKTLECQRAEDKWFRYSLGLGNAFTAAKKKGARKLLGAPKVAGAKPTFYRFAGGKLDVATKQKPGYVTATELSKQVLEAIGTRKSSALKVTSKKPASHATSRIGGLPSGISLDKWPKLDGKPMGFLFQLLVQEHLAKHAAIAVFVALDGSATEDEDRNKVVLLSKQDLARAPVKAPPDGVPVLAEKAIVVEAPLPEIDEDAIGDLTAKDPDLAAAFDRYQASTKVQEPSLASKLGGSPMWLQGGPDGIPVLAQLDIDYVQLDKSWRDAGLAGCIYIMTDKNEKSASALWQYT